MPVVHPYRVPYPTPCDKDMEDGITSLPPLEQEILIIIIQNNKLNSNSTTYVCALITSRIKRLDLREHVLLPEMKGLPKRSMVMAEQQATVALEQLIDYRGRVDWEIFKKINSAVRICEKSKKDNY